MTMKYPLVLLATLLGAVSYAHGERPYVGLDFQRATLDGQRNSVDLDNAMLRAGTSFRKYLGAEFQMGMGIGDSTVKVGSDTITIKSKLFIAAFAKPQLNFGPHDNFSIYGLLGAAHYRTENDTAEYSSTSSAGGVGINAFLNNGLGIGAEYVVYDTDIEAINFGIRYRY